jgi:hypothetical protein
MEITLNLFVWEIKNVPLVLVLIGAVFLGYLLASVYLYPRLWKKKKECKKLIIENKKLTELATTEELSQTEEPIEETNPEGMELDEDYGDSFFKN